MDEIQRLMVQVEGQSRLRELNELLAAEQKTLEGVLGLWKQHGAYTQAQQEQALRTAKSMLENQKEMAQWQEKLGQGGGMAGMRARFHAMAAGGQAGAMLGSAFEGDVAGMTAGLGGFVNQAAFMAGAGPGVIVGTELATRLTDIIIKNSERFGDQKARAAEAELKYWQAQYDRIAQEGTAAQQQRAAGAATGIEQAGSATVLRGLETVIGGRQGFMQSKEYLDAKAALEQRRWVAGFMPGYVRRQLGFKDVRELTGEIEDLKTEVPQAEAAKLVQEAKLPGEAGDLARHRLIQLIRENPNNFPGIDANTLERSFFPKILFPEAPGAQIALDVQHGFSEFMRQEAITNRQRQILFQEQQLHAQRYTDVEKAQLQIQEERDREARRAGPPGPETALTEAGAAERLLQSKQAEFDREEFFRLRAAAGGERDIERQKWLRQLGELSISGPRAQEEYRKAYGEKRIELEQKLADLDQLGQEYQVAIANANNPSYIDLMLGRVDKLDQMYEGLLRQLNRLNAAPISRGLFNLQPRIW